MEMETRWEEVDLISRVLKSPGLVLPQNISGGTRGTASCRPGLVLPFSNHTTCEDGGGGLNKDT